MTCGRYNSLEPHVALITLMEGKVRIGHATVLVLARVCQRKGKGKKMKSQEVIMMLPRFG